MQGEPRRRASTVPFGAIFNLFHRTLDPEAAWKRYPVSLGERRVVVALKSPFQEFLLQGAQMSFVTMPFAQVYHVGRIVVVQMVDLRFGRTADRTRQRADFTFANEFLCFCSAPHFIQRRYDHKVLG